jgi:hypothetical protein
MVAGIFAFIVRSMLSLPLIFVIVVIPPPSLRAPNLLKTCEYPVRALCAIDSPLKGFIMTP